MRTPPAPDLLALGLHIRRLRERRGLSAEGLAEAAGMSRRGLIYIEHGRRDAGYRTLVAISLALGEPLTIPVPVSGDQP